VDTFGAAVDDVFRLSDFLEVVEDVPSRAIALELEQTLRTMATRRPLLLWVDDAQWALPVVKTMAKILRDAPSLPILMLLTVQEEALATRPEEESFLASTGWPTLSIGPLDQGDHRVLLRSLLDVSTEVLNQLAHRTSGNPMFALHLVSDWIDRGWLRPGPAGFVLVDDAAPVFPDDLHDAWMARLGSLGCELEVLEAAAVLGQSVLLDEWAVVAGVEVDDARDALVDARLAEATEGGIRFTHAMLRESLQRAAADGGRLVRHHGRCADLLQARSDADSQPVTARIGAHLFHAGRWAEALHPLAVGCGWFRSQGDIGGGRAMLGCYASAVAELDLPADDPVHGFLAYEELNILFREHRYEALLDAATRLIAVAKTNGWTDILSNLLRLRSVAWTETGAEHARARELVDLQDAATVGTGSQRGRALQDLAFIQVRQGLVDEATISIETAMETLGALVAQAPTFNARQQRADAVGIASVIALWRGDIAQAVTHARDSLDQTRALGMEYALSRPLNHLGSALAQDRQFEAARRCFEEAEVVARRWRDHYADIAPLNLASIDVSFRRSADARARAEAVLKTTPHQGLRIGCHLLLLCCAALDADWDAARRHLDPCIDSWRMGSDMANARLLELAATLATEGDEVALSKRICDEAALHWTSMGRHELAAAARDGRPMHPWILQDPER
jgi:tetratricopeptide (TPR) repeat protein